jgi:hypothetical protein
LRTFSEIGFALAMLAPLTRTAPMFHRHVNYTKSPIGGEEGARIFRCFWRTLATFGD